MERHEVEQQLTRELGRDERLLWSGRPRQGVMLRAADAFLIPFSLLWCGFAIFWEATALASPAPFFFKLWGIPFVLVGLYMVFGRFIADSVERKHTIYGLTNERIIIIGGLFKRTVKSLSLRTLSDVVLAERPDGRGTITLGRAEGVGWFGSAFPGNRQTPPPALEGIENVRAVYEQLRQAQKTA
ncbi:MAG TPA: PH domain-containing protein [Thermoanaerobaculia bacterium]|nr:PH domain-containing protein [Thermoanaerobaculia bacterium]